MKKIPNVCFVLREPNENEETVIHMIVRDDSKSKVINTGLKCFPPEWDNGRRRIKNLRSIDNQLEKNQRLDYLEKQFTGTYHDLINEKKQFNLTDLVIKFKNELNGSEKEPIDLISFIYEFIEFNKKSKKEGTVKTYISTLNRLHEYQKERNILLNWDSITLPFYYDFIHFLEEKNLAKNTIGKHIKTLKIFLNDGYHQGLHNNLEFRHPKFKKLKEKVKKIYLNETELQRINNLVLGHPKLDLIRDLFLIGAYTGLRYSDYSQLKEENFRKTAEGLFLDVITRKTNQRVTIPINSLIETILKKHNFNLPISPSNQMTNKLLKLIALKAGLNDIVEIVKHEGGKRVNKQNKKYELVSSHVARRSFATNAYLASVPSISIMKITGHASEEVFLAYICISTEENALLMNEHPFFN